MKIQNEGDFLYAFYKERQEVGGLVFPRVTEIPKGKQNTIKPDIDLLELRTSDPKTVGYEVKVLRFREKQFPLSEFYKLSKTSLFLKLLIVRNSTFCQN